MQSDELQDEYESAKRQQSSRDAAAAAAGSPTRLIRSYDGQVVEQGQDMPPPPSYIDSTVAGVQSNQQQQWPGSGDSLRQFKAPYNQAPYQQYQQPYPQQPAATGSANRPTTVIRVVQASPRNTRSTPRTIVAIVIGIKAILLIILLIYFLAIR